MVGILESINNAIFVQLILACVYNDQIIAVTCKYAQNALLIYLHMCIFGNR